MTPKAKAKRLVNLMTIQLESIASQYNRDTGMVKTYSKMCAFIAIDEIINELECAYNGEPITTNDHKEYWQEVKKELKNI